MKSEKSNELYKIKANVLKALAHPIRLKIVDFLSKGERCVCEIVPLVKAERSNVSRHLAILLKADIVSTRKVGLNIYYKLKMNCAKYFIDCCADVIKQQVNERMILIRGDKRGR